MKTKEQPILPTCQVGRKRTSSVQSRIIKSAESYVRKRDANPDAWFKEPNIVHLPATAGFKALYLLYKESPPAFAALSTNIWSKWISIILDCPVFDSQEAHVILARKAYEVVPEDTLLWLTRILEKEKQNPMGLPVLTKITGLWDRRIAGLFLQTAKDAKISSHTLDNLLKSLLEHGETEAVSLAESLLNFRLSHEESGREKALSAARVLLEYSPGSWNVLWPLIVEDSRFAKTLMARIANTYYHTPALFLNRLREQQVTELSCWLFDQ